MSEANEVRVVAVSAPTAPFRDDEPRSKAVVERAYYRGKVLVEGHRASRSKAGR